MATAVMEKPLGLVESGRQSTPVSVDSFEVDVEYAEEAEACIETILAPPLKKTWNEVKVDTVGVIGVQVDRSLCQDITEIESSSGPPQKMCLVVSFMTDGKVIASTPCSLSLKTPSSKEEARMIAEVSSLGGSLVERTLSESDVATSVKGKILQEIFAVWGDRSEQSPERVTFHSPAEKSGTGESSSDIDVIVYLAETGADKTVAEFLSSTPIAIGSLRIGGKVPQDSMICDVPLRKPLPGQSYPTLKLMNPNIMPKTPPTDIQNPSPKSSPPRTTKKKKRGFGLFGRKKSKGYNIRKEAQGSTTDVSSPPHPKPIVNTAYTLDETQGAFLRLNVEWKEKKSNASQEVLSSFSVKLDVQKKNLEEIEGEVDLKYETEKPAELPLPEKSLASAKISVEGGKVMTKSVSFKLDKEEIPAAEETESPSLATPTGDEEMDRNENVGADVKGEVEKSNDLPTDYFAEEKKTEEDDNGYFTTASRDFAQFVEAASNALTGSSAQMKKAGSLSRSRILHQLETESEPLTALETIRLQSGINKDTLTGETSGPKDVETQIVQETVESTPEHSDTQLLNEPDASTAVQKRAVTPSPAELSIERKLEEEKESLVLQKKAVVPSPAKFPVNQNVEEDIKESQIEKTEESHPMQERAVTPSPADLSIEQKLGEEVNATQDKKEMESLPIKKRAGTPSPAELSIEQKLSWENKQPTPKRGHTKSSPKSAGQEPTTLKTSSDESVNKMANKEMPDLSVSQINKTTISPVDTLASLMEVLNEAPLSVIPPSRRHDEDELSTDEEATRNENGEVTKDNLEETEPDPTKSKIEEEETKEQVELQTQAEPDQGNDASLLGKDDETFFTKSTYRRDDEVTFVPSPLDVLEESYNRCGVGRIADIVDDARCFMGGQSRYPEMGHDDTFTFDEPTFDPSLISGDGKSDGGTLRPQSPCRPSTKNDRNNSPKGVSEFPRHEAPTKIESLSEVFTNFVTCGYGTNKPKNPPGLIQNSDTTDVDDLTLTTYEMQVEIEEYKEKIEQVRKKAESLDDGEDVGDETLPLFQPPDIERDIHTLSSF